MHPHPGGEASPPAPSCLCVYTPLWRVWGGGDRRPRRRGDALGPRSPGVSVPPGLVVVCVSALAPGLLGEGGRAAGGPGRPWGCVTLPSRPRRPPDPADCPPTRWRQGLVWLGLEEPRALARCPPPHAPRLTLGRGRSVGARARACRCLRRSWRELARSAHPVPIFRPGDSGGQRLSGLTGPGPSPALPPAPLPGAQPAACLCRLCPLGAGSLRPGIISQARGPRAKGGSRWSCGLRGGWRLPMAKVTQHERRCLPELEERGRSRPEGGEGPQAVRPVSSCPAPGLGRKPQGSRLRACWDRVRKLPGVRENPIIVEQNAPSRR